MNKKIKYRILFVDDDPRVLETLQLLYEIDYDVIMVSSGEASLEKIKEDADIAAVVMDIKMPGMDGIAAAREIKKLAPALPVIFHTAYPGEFDEDQIDANEKPFDYVQKGESISRLTRSIRNAVESYALKNNDLLFTMQAETDFEMVGRSPLMQEVFAMIRRMAKSDAKVQITGESGTGKDMVARAIHNNSPRKNQRFACYNCHQKSPDMLESELFGHVKGAFTGAIEDRVGIFEYADGGTLFIDEVGDMDVNTQGKLLRVIETGEYTRLGSPEVRRCNVRVLWATNKNLDELVRNGTFRHDLYFRLKGVPITLPPLRHRREDIPLMVEKFKDSRTINKGFSPKIFDQTALDALCQYDWPGNVRDLMEAVEVLIESSDSDIIFGDDVRAYLKQPPLESVTAPADKWNLRLRMRDFRRTCIIEALRETNNNISAAARLLGVDRVNLHKMIKSLNIKLPC